MYYTTTQRRKPEPYKWIRKERSRGKVGIRREELLRALAMLPRGSGAETVHIECKHLMRKHKCVSILTASNKELKIILQIIFLLCIHMCTGMNTYVYEGYKFGLGGFFIPLHFFCCWDREALSQNLDINDSEAWEMLLSLHPSTAIACDLQTQNIMYAFTCTTFPLSHLPNSHRWSY